MDKVIVNPTAEQLRDLFHAATVEANGRARTRTIDTNSITCDFRCMNVGGSPSGARETNGGGVANSYGYAAETSVLEYAWFTDAAGAKHVRVVSARVRVSGRHVSTILPGTRTQQQKLIDAGAEFALVYGDLFAAYAGRVAGAEGFSRRLKKDPTDSVTWLALADWLADRDLPANHLLQTPADADTAARIRGVFLAPVTA